MTTSSNKDKGEVENGGKWKCGYCGEFGYGRDFMEKHKCKGKSMTTSSKTNKSRKDKKENVKTIIL